MMILKTFCTESMIPLVIVCQTLLSTIILSLIIFNFLFVLKISLLFVGIYE